MTSSTAKKVRHRNIDLFNGRFRLRLKTPKGEVRQSFESLDEALIARHRIRLEYPERAQRLRRRALPHKTSSLPAGVSRTEKASRGNSVYVVYQVSWVDTSGKGRVTSFQAGAVHSMTGKDEAHAKRTAIAFRKAYEFATEHGMGFYPDFYRQWKDVQCFPFRPPAPAEKQENTRPAESPPPPSIEKSLALPHDPAPEQVAALRGQFPDLEAFRATILVARFGTAMRAAKFVKAGPEEQERLWPAPGATK